jgi:hypothetical protein
MCWDSGKGRISSRRGAEARREEKLEIRNIKEGYYGN